MEYYYIKKEDFVKFISDLNQEYKCFVPQKIKQDDYILAPFSLAPSEEIIFNEYRSVEPLKSYLAFAKEEVARYFSADVAKENNPPICLMGVKSCDLFSLKIQDFVFEQGEVVDPQYSARRKNTLLISSDCTAFKEACFCLALNILPHPTELFDINLSPVHDGFVVEVASQLGKETIKNYSEYFEAANSEQISGRAQKRSRFIEKMKKALEPKQLAQVKLLQKAVKQGFSKLNYWQELALTCVECGACNFICCTCHCFLLSDGKSEGKFKRFRQWDACLYANFARVAGGANPLKMRSQRLRNRYMKKFDFFPDNLGLYACTGCGRCIECCPAKIDIRKVLRDLTYDATSTK